MFAVLEIVAGYDRDIDDMEQCGSYTTKEDADDYCKLLALRYGRYFYVVEVKDSAIDKVPERLREFGITKDEIERNIIDHNEREFQERDERYRKQALEIRLQQHLRDATWFACTLRNQEVDHDTRLKKLTEYMSNIEEEVAVREHIFERARLLI